MTKFLLIMVAIMAWTVSISPHGIKTDQNEDFGCHGHDCVDSSSNNDRDVDADYNGHLVEKRELEPTVTNSTYEDDGHKERAMRCPQKKKCIRQIGASCVPKGSCNTGVVTKGCNKKCDCCTPVPTTETPTTTLSTIIWPKCYPVICQPFSLEWFGICNDGPPHKYWSRLPVEGQCSKGCLCYTPPGLCGSKVCTVEWTNTKGICAPPSSPPPKRFINYGAGQGCDEGCDCYAQYSGCGIPGGWCDVNPPDATTIQFLKTFKTQVEKKLGYNVTEFIITSYSQQVVDGMNYNAKVRIGENHCIQFQVYSQPWTNTSKLMGVQDNVVCDVPTTSTQTEVPTEALTTEVPTEALTTKTSTVAPTEPRTTTPETIAASRCNDVNGFLTLYKDECFIYIPGFRSWHDVKSVCSGLGLKMATPKDGNAIWLRKYIVDNYDDGGHGSHTWVNGQGNGTHIVMSGEIIAESNPLWSGNEPATKVTTSHCLFLLCTTYTLRVGPYTPYFSYDCSWAGGYTICELE